MVPHFILIPTLTFMLWIIFTGLHIHACFLTWLPKFFCLCLGKKSRNHHQVISIYSSLSMSYMCLFPRSTCITKIHAVLKTPNRWISHSGMLHFHSPYAMFILHMGLQFLTLLVVLDWFVFLKFCYSFYFVFV